MNEEPDHAADASRFRDAIRAAAIRAGLLHNPQAPLTDDQLLALLQNVADAAHYARNYAS